MMRSMNSLGLVVVLAFPAGARAQDPPDFGRGEDRTHPTLDSVRVALEVEATWRGLLLGPSAVSLFADFPLWGRPLSALGDWGLVAHVAAAAVHDARPTAVSHGHYGGGLTLYRYFDGGEPWIGLSVDGYDVPDAAADRSGVELGLRVGSVEWSWGLEEVNPTFALGLYRDFGRFDGFRADLDFDLGLGIQNVAFWIFRDVSGWIEGRGMWNEYADETEAYDDLGWRAGLGALLDAGVWSIAVRGGGMDPLDDDARGWGEIAVIVFPAGR